MTKDNRTERQKLDDQLHTRGELPFLRTPYNYDRNKASDDAGLNCPEPSLTKQAFAEEADINYIVKQFGLTGQLPQVQAPVYADYDQVFDFQTAQNAIRTATENFMELPAATRAKFHNDPQELLEYVTKEENYDEAVKLGLILPEQALKRAKELQEQRNKEAEAEQAKLNKAASEAVEKAAKATKKDT